mmetsp:Transcript_42831/g.104694  ORF Transcript_42831/g.104694 Transcript_42831/m.104694 type:complete len:106 (-) Transcript_42831:450-767(-)|eukprot:CAMPEP_0206272766 /NCGR_PEP_ID=MMETSP0047_2-20121206/34189_1 /ASSEMBLY_ACC=CAM_ASM_000192 /TAXON_ID=195065 /ORGANISM="Chroomonas mesostigmatica_cf, Strain CCMP1168" /LENGTH=105 /DNA_ID=CAMNT_0053701721 /DNA_START=164 /DNA_END=481 /DNA_ORIENTATION=+
MACVSTLSGDTLGVRTLPADGSLRRRRSFKQWLQLKYMQYNVTSGLYMLDWWEKILFNIIIASILATTIMAMTIFFQDSVPLFFLVTFLFGFVMFLLLLCPLHQY